jgi:hypothetical protein
MKVVRHFPIIPRLKQMYNSTTISKLLQWHATNKSSDGFVRHVANSKTWAHVDAKWPSFVIEFQNLKLAISTNDFNPFSKKLCQWCTWLVYVLIYNLPPWLTTKHFFVLVALIIQGKESVYVNNINIYLHPLMVELMKLWNPGISPLDYGKPKGSHGFVLCALILWTIHDFPGYGFLSRCVHQRYVACFMCGLENTFQHSQNLKKVVYMGHCMSRP